jgi:hypothetical protein
MTKLAPRITEAGILQVRDLTRQGKTIREIAATIGFCQSSVARVVAKFRREGILGPKASGRPVPDAAPHALKEYAPKGDHKGFLKELAKSYQKPVPAPPKPNSILHQIQPDAMFSRVGSPAALCERE